MALKKYNVTVNKMATVVQLNEKDAKARGLTDKDLVGAKKSPAPAPAPAPDDAEKAAADKAAADAKAAADKADADAKAAAAPANKSRAAANK